MPRGNKPKGNKPKGNEPQGIHHPSIVPQNYKYSPTISNPEE